ncbi:MAG: DUF4350 domain-containing protein [Alicyclobacillaceae bacterium]|nr:DUF4350 domain-containing protein [Alicyclobacillaceae bacterium]
MRVRTWWWALLAAAAYAGVLAWVGRSQAAALDIPGSSTSAGPRGALAVAELWRRLGIPFSVWAQPPALLPADGRGSLVAVEPGLGQYPPQRARQLLAWVRQGHRLVWVADRPDAVLRQLGLAVVPTDQRVASVMLVDSGGRRSRPRRRNPAAAQVRTEAGAVAGAPVRDAVGSWTNLSFRARGVFTGSGLRQARQEVRTADGHILGAVLREGRGQVVVWSAPAVFENRSIGQRDNFRPVWWALAGQPLWWDEFGHGVVEHNLVGWMFSGPRAWSLLPLLCAAAVYLWGASVRFGRPRHHPGDEPRPGTEWVDALAWHLGRPKLRAYAVELAAAAIERRLGAGAATGEQREAWRAAKDAASRGGRRAWQAFVAQTRQLAGSARTALPGRTTREREE